MAARRRAPVGANADRILDFSHARGDRIDLAVIDASTAAAGNQAFSFIGAGAITLAVSDFALSPRGTAMAPMATDVE